MRTYSAEQRKKAIETFARFGCSAADTIAELGYPNRNTLRNWWKEYQIGGDEFLERGHRRSKYSDEEKQDAVDYYLEHGKSLARTIRQFRFKPFDGWRQTMVEDKKGQPVYERADGPKALAWWTDCNSVKHNRAVIDEARGSANYEKANQGNLLHSLGALFLMNRMLMKCIDEDGYASAKRSSLFKLCGSIDEARTSLFYDSQG